MQKKSEEKIIVYESLPKGIKSIGKPRAGWKDQVSYIKIC